MSPASCLALISSGKKLKRSHLTGETLTGKRPASTSFNIFSKYFANRALEASIDRSLGTPTFCSPSI